MGRIREEQRTKLQKLDAINAHPLVGNNVYNNIYIGLFGLVSNPKLHTPDLRVALASGPTTIEVQENRFLVAPQANYTKNVLPLTPAT